MRSIVVLAALSSLGACMAVPPPAAAPTEVIAQSAQVSLATLPATTAARWTGSFRGSGGTLVISRAGDQLYASRSGGTPIALSLIGFGTFSDASGTAYLFMPADGSSGQLDTIARDGSRLSWGR